MKVSELIKKLEEVKSEAGDIEVVSEGHTGPNSVEDVVVAYFPFGPPEPGEPDPYELRKEAEKNKLIRICGSRPVDW